jgi:hypothetical protein
MSLQIKSAISHILQVIFQAGFYCTFTTNPNVQYGTAKYRKTRNPEDRVYAIMQMYNIRVGQSLRPNDRPLMDSLIREFGLAINSRSPLLGQLFLHTTRPNPGSTWCISEASRVSPDLLSYTKPKCQASISQTSHGLIRAAGPCCSFADWITVQSTTRFNLRLDISEGVFLDDYIAPSVDLFDEKLLGLCGDVQPPHNLSQPTTIINIVLKLFEALGVTM